MPKITRKKPSIASTIKKQKENKTRLIPHLVIIARAGTGKTTTLIEGLKKLRGIESDHPASKNPSDQQRDIWEFLLLSKEAVTVNFVAFNSSIAAELKNRVPQGCNAMTSHSMGFQVIRDTFGSVRVENGRCQDMIAELLDDDIWRLRRQRMAFLKATEELVELCKMNLVPGYDSDVLDALVERYQTDLGPYREEVYELVPKVIERSLNVAKDKQIQFIDMIWLPIALDLPVPRYDLLLVDEAQDLNRCQQELVQRAGQRLILCGDDRQAIYGFAGADSESIPRMVEILKGTEAKCEVLPLTYTRRCGKAIVAEANKIVPDFHAFDDAPTGLVGKMSLNASSDNGYYGYVEPNDMVLCRVNAPLVRECFRFLKAGVKAHIQGRDVGAGLIKTVKDIAKRSPFDDMTVTQLITALEAWLRDEEQKENKKRHPSETRLQSLHDKYSCLMAFCDNQPGDKSHTIVILAIERLFSDDTKGSVRFSSVHRAKGLEADRVFILMPKGSGMPHPMAKAEWERDQEMNLLYVAITRAKSELYFVTEED